GVHQRSCRRIPLARRRAGRGVRAAGRLQPRRAPRRRARARTRGAVRTGTLQRRGRTALVVAAQPDHRPELGHTAAHRPLHDTLSAPTRAPAAPLARRLRRVLLLCSLLPRRLRRVLLLLPLLPRRLRRVLLLPPLVPRRLRRVLLLLPLLPRRLRRASAASLVAPMRTLFQIWNIAAHTRWFIRLSGKVTMKPSQPDDQAGAPSHEVIARRFQHQWRRLRFPYAQQAGGRPVDRP